MSTTTATPEGHRSPQPAERVPAVRGADGEVDVAEVITAFGRLQLTGDAILKTVAADYDIGASDLRALSFVASSRGEVTPKQVSEHLDLTSGATTALLDRMTKAGYVHRVPHPTDRRSSVLEVAAAGQSVMTEVMGFYAAAFREAVDPYYLDFIATSLRAIDASLREHGAARVAQGR